MKTCRNEDWKTVFLKNLEIDIPSDDWSLLDHQEFEIEEDSVMMPSYFTDILHQPTGLVVTVSGYLSSEFTCAVVYADRHAEVPVDEQEAVLSAWNSFVTESIPALRAFHHTIPCIPGLEFVRTMYDSYDLEFWYLTQGVVTMLVTDFKRGNLENA